MPITWKNVNAPSFTGVAALGESGNDAVRQGTADLRNSLNSFVARDKEKTQADVDEFINSFKTVEGFQQASDEGLLSNESLKKRFGSNFDSSAAAINRDSQLGENRTRLQDDAAFQQFTDNRADEPKIRDITAALLAANGDPAEYGEIEQGIKQADLNNPNIAMQLLQDARGAAETKSRADTTYDQKIIDASVKRKNAATLFNQNQTDRDTRLADEKVAKAKRADDALAREEIALLEGQLSDHIKRNPGTEIVNPQDPAELAAMREFAIQVGASGSNEDGISNLIKTGYRYVPGRDHDASSNRKNRRDDTDIEATEGLYVPAAVHQAALSYLDGDRTLPDWFDHSKKAYKKLIDSLMIEYVQGNANALNQNTQQSTINRLKSSLGAP